MTSYKNLERFIMSLLVIYVMVGFSTRLLPAWSDKSIIPFYSWFFFVDVPERVQLPALIILENNEIILEDPVFYQDAVGIVEQPRSPKVRELTTKLRKSLDENNKEDIMHFRSILEEGFLPGCIRYSVADIEYNPINRWRSREYMVVTSEEFSTTCKK